MTLEYNPAHARLKYVRLEISRYGRKMWYFVGAKTRKRIRLVGDYGSRAFMEHYRELIGILPDKKAMAERILRLRVKNACSRDRMKDRVPEITPDWAVAQMRKQKYRCALTSIEFLCRDALSKNNPYSPSLDRIDNSKGYTIDNVRIVLFAVNAMLLDWGIEVLDHITDEYYSRMPRLAPDFLVRASVPDKQLNSGG